MPFKRKEARWLKAFEPLRPTVPHGFAVRQGPALPLLSTTARSQLHAVHGVHPPVSRLCIWMARSVLIRPFHVSLASQTACLFDLLACLSSALPGHRLYIISGHGGALSVHAPRSHLHACLALRGLAYIAVLCAGLSGALSVHAPLLQLHARLTIRQPAGSAPP